MNLNKIVEEWVGEEITIHPLFDNKEDEIRYWQYVGRNEALKDLKQRIPQLTERIVEEIGKHKIKNSSVYITGMSLSSEMNVNKTIDEIIKSLTE